MNPRGKSFKVVGPSDLRDNPSSKLNAELNLENVCSRLGAYAIGEIMRVGHDIDLKDPSGFLWQVPAAGNIRRMQAHRQILHVACG